MDTPDDTMTTDAPTATLAPPSAARPIRPADCGCGGGDGGDEADEHPFVYAIGQIDVRFPSLGVEREFLQANQGIDTRALSDPQARHKVLAERRNRYLVRQLCWVLTISGVDTYLLHPADPADYELFVDALRPPDDANDDAFDQVVGVRGPHAPASACNGLAVPVVRVDQLYSYTRRALIEAIPRPAAGEGKGGGGGDAAEFELAARDLFERRILQLTDNAGVADEHRAVNYLAVRYPEIYAATVRQNAQGRSLVGVTVLPSRLSGSARRLVNVVFEYADRGGGYAPEKLRVRVDVTEEFPFIDQRLAPYFDR